MSSVTYVHVNIFTKNFILLDHILGAVHKLCLFKIGNIPSEIISTNCGLHFFECTYICLVILSMSLRHIANIILLCMFSFLIGFQLKSDCKKDEKLIVEK